MLTLVSTAGLILMTGIGTAQTANDPIATRKALMSSVGAAAGLGGGMMKGEIAYTPAAGKAAIAAMNASAVAFGDYFPEGSDQGDTKAAAAIWSDPDGFMAEINKFAAATGAAMEASGRPGPADIDAFKAAFGPVLATCKSCHEGFRTR
ncbi:cytochrome c [Roseibium denhamense]|nr:cytochrome c [Roseibium denhamense]MTI06106.1 cytochrome c [Roseibium denhamense]